MMNIQQHAQAILLAIISMIAFSSGELSPAATTDNAGEKCTRQQCLILDFLNTKNKPLFSLKQATEAYGAFVKEPTYGLTEVDFSDRGELCKLLPFSDCFSRVIAIRQKVYRPKGSSQLVGCLIIGGTMADSKFGRIYRAFGIIYDFADVRLKAIGIRSNTSLNGAPTFEDLLSDPC